MEGLTVTVGEDHVASVEFARPPHNHFDVELIAALADAYEALDADPGCRAIVLCSAGRHFCAGANFAGAGETGVPSLYHHAVRLFAAATPVVAAVQGAAIGGGLGLALSADLRVASASSRFAANFARLGIHHGFGLTVTLPAVVGMQAALDLLYTGRRVKGEEAYGLGLCDRLAPDDDLRGQAHALAREIAASAPLAVGAIRQTMRGDLAERVRAATAREHDQQAPLFATEDFQEGVRATAERRAPRFTGR
ncbi:MAG TPA: enoyl-CoA hydratase/isomerase family protein [Solirubrobacteraceae bacterium]|nr:enoyl-CoA hydratase/isomerase family protein [Solirubrobacteraceae bacterium]